MDIRKACLLLLCCLPFAGRAQQQTNDLPVHVSVIVKDHTDNKDLILYERKEPLVYADFKGKPDAASNGVGATYSGILMEMEGEVRNGKLEVIVHLSIYCDKTKSWMKKEGKTERVLAHEQRHFDLTAIKACGLAKALAEEKYTKDNVKTKIRALHQQYTHALQELQQAYDTETVHGTISDKQDAWNSRIDKGLAGSTCI